MKNAEILSELLKAQMILLSLVCTISNSFSELYCSLAARKISDAVDNINETIMMLTKEK